MSQITTEITSSQIKSDNPLHQRLLFAYEAAKNYVNGTILEVGCGEGRGISVLQPYITHYIALDKNIFLLDSLSKKYPNYQFVESLVPPFSNIESNSIDTLIAFQVIEHIKDDDFFLKEIHRVLKPNGKALISTPNIQLTLTRNPWHEREYKDFELKTAMLKYFHDIEYLGITGDKKVFDYYELNKKSVEKITRWDIFDLQHKLPNSILRVPYDFLNRINRNRMMNKDNSLVSEIGLENYALSSDLDRCFDLFYVATKN